MIGGIGNQTVGPPVFKRADVIMVIISNSVSYLIETNLEKKITHESK
jgi:hypothetical protein